MPLFAVDFTWEELQTLRTRQRYSFRDHSYDGKHADCVHSVDCASASGITIQGY